MSVHYREMKEAIGHNWYLVDPNMVAVMDRLIEPADRAWVEEKLRAMGRLIGHDVAANAEVTDKNGAQLVRWDRDGEETNEVVHHATALETKRLLWKNDFLHLAWSEDHLSRGRALPRPMRMAYDYLLSQAETGMLCSVAMTLGVLRLIEAYGDDATQALFVEGLTSNDFDTALHGSMYLTEKEGGSDLGRTETTAELIDGQWRLNGFKWFCSNVDGTAILTLARPVGAPEGIRGLALFAVARTLPDGSNNGIHVRRIKDKLGTRAVPTGEIDMVDTVGHALCRGGDALDGRGINRMMEFVNESRMGVAAMGAGIMRRSFLEAAIRAEHREAFGGPLSRHGMMREQLIDLMAESEAAAAMLFEAANRMPVDGSAIGDDDSVARILVPLTKMRCTRGGIESASLALEVFGGNGYIEDWPMARQYRDAQCHTIWEGPENVLALDVLRAMRRFEAHTSLLAFIGECVDGAAHPLLERTAATVRRAYQQLKEDLGRLASVDKDTAQLRARRLANSMARVTQLSIVLAEAQWQLTEKNDAHKAIVAAWLTRKHLEPRGSWHEGNEAICRELFESLTRYESISPETAAEHGQL